MKKSYVFPLLAATAVLPHAANAQAGYASYCNAESADPSYSAGTFAPNTCDTNGRLRVSVANPWPAGTNLIGGVFVQASASGGATPYQLLSAATPNATNIKASGGNIYDVYALNTNSTTAYLKFYNTATTPQCGTNVVQLTYPLVQNVPVHINPVPGVTFTAGISVCLTANQAVTDNASATTGITLSLIYN